MELPMYGSEDREDERLQEADEDLERGEEHERVNENGRMTTYHCRTHSAAHRTLNVTRIRWPASMFAKSRTACENSRTSRICRTR